MSNCMDYSLTLLFFSNDTVFIILPLAEEYQVSEVKGRCEHFVIQTLEKAINYEIKRPDLHTLLKYISCAELYNLLSVLPLAVTMCAKYTTESLTEACTLQTPFSEKTLLKICTERTRLTETLAKERIEKGKNFCMKIGKSQMIVIENYLRTTTYSSTH